MGLARVGGFRRFKRSAAAAAPDSVRIVDAKAGASEIVAIVDRRSAQECQTLRIERDPHAILLDDLVAFVRMIEFHPVLHPRATPGLHEKAQPRAIRAMLGGEALQMAHSGIGKTNHNMARLPRPRAGVEGGFGTARAIGDK